MFCVFFFFFAPQKNCSNGKDTNRLTEQTTGDVNKNKLVTEKQRGQKRDRGRKKERGHKVRWRRKEREEERRKDAVINRDKQEQQKLHTLYSMFGNDNCVLRT